MPGLDRLRLYDYVLDLTAGDLLFAPDELRLGKWDRSAGWPILLGSALQTSDTAVLKARLVNFLEEECLTDLDEADLCTPLHSPKNMPSWLVTLLPPLAHSDTSACRLVQQALAEAVEQRLLLRRTGGVLVAQLSPRGLEVLQQRPQHLEAMLLRLLEQELADEALALFCRGAGFSIIASVMRSSCGWFWHLKRFSTTGRRNWRSAVPS
ncbi:hypothetical protein FS827_26510 [Agrobacterium vitis]|uniref:hypothetical protein n=1 Tax=Allorhizobium ampelinum TaxID=3025782 RepID=UPI001F252AD3|nr:hypothetical protein [Allorhizobium ampelinum]MCF1464821.1 hypothetical protein [Allorhizobium ampelinum]